MFKLTNMSDLPLQSKVKYQNTPTPYFYLLGALKSNFIPELKTNSFLELKTNFAAFPYIFSLKSIFLQKLSKKLCLIRSPRTKK